MPEDRNLIQGTVEAVIYQNAENGYTVLKLDAGEGGGVTVVGCLPGVAPGEGLSVSGAWVRHASYGEQFKAETVERRMPAGEKAIFDYLASGAVRGIGAATARRMVETFGGEALTVLEEHPERLTRIQGITRKRALAMGEHFRLQMGMRRLLDFLGEHQMPLQLAMPLYRRYGDRALEMVRSNPYLLVDGELGVDFAAADELTKTRLNGEDEAAKLAAENVLCYVLLRILELLHPFMPFITEEIWQALPHEGDYLIRAKWPEYHSAFDFRAEEQAMEAVKDAISAVRARRAEMNVPPSKKAQMIIVSDHAEDYRLGEHFIKRMAYASELTVTDASPADLTGLVTVVTHGANVYLPLAELVDFEKELERIAKERAKAAENLARIEQKLSNEKFVSKAPEAVVNAEREKAEKARALIAKLDESAAAMRG